MRWIIAVLAIGCTSTASNPDVGNASLGIARFEAHEAAGTTTVIGRAADGSEVGRLELFKGRFTLSGVFAEEHDNLEVVGRKLHVQVLDEAMDWETEGFDPTMDLPEHPASQRALAAFLADEHVRPILAGSGIAFRSLGGLDAAACGIVTGTNFCLCAGGTGCMGVKGNPVGVCNLVGPDAYVVHQRANGGYRYDPLSSAEVTYDQTLVARCCPNLGPNAPDIIARKVCPDPTDCTLQPGGKCHTTCGDVDTVRCIACPAYRSHGSCAIFDEGSAGWSDPSAPLINYFEPDSPGYMTSYCGEDPSTPRPVDEQQVVHNVCVTICGDGLCDTVRENCASCPLDCGCQGFDTCGGGGTAGQCGCTPATCPAGQCGTLDDGCGGTITCGCTGFDTCGGGGVAGMCGCTPATSCPAGFQCGTIDDGCGGTVDCSGGRTCAQISGKKHFECVADQHLCCNHGRCVDEDEQ
jgi:hypothetical protein